MISYRATLDVPLTTVQTLSRRLQAHDIRPWQHAATCRMQAILVLPALYAAALVLLHLQRGSW